MSESKFTPGPWDLLPVKNSDSVRIFAGNHYICSIGNSDDEPIQTQSNARLTAAAPDMYEALKRIEPIVEAMEMLSVNKAERGCLAEALHAAIAKAEGRE